MEIYSSWINKKRKKHYITFFIFNTNYVYYRFSVVYFFVIPVAWDFFVGFNTQISDQGLKVELEPKVNEYLSLILKLILAFGLAFQIPLAIILLTKLRLVSSETLKHNRRYIIVLVFLVAAMITPPDIFSQIILAIPILFLYELCIFFSKFIEKKKK